MKKIYTVTLEGGDPLSGGFKDNLRIIATMVYGHIDSLFADGVSPLNVNKNIVRNVLHYSYDSCLDYYKKSNYKLESDINDNKKINYEPFIVEPRTFAITIVDDNFAEDELRQIVEQTLRLFVLNYGISIRCFPYDSKDDDERGRRKIIKSISEMFSPKKIDRKRSLILTFGKLRRFVI